jgi:hypothetical protein
MVNGTQVIAAGFAAATAAFVTSRFGVAGTLLGAAVTAMIITGGSAILKAYFESVTGRVRKVPSRVRARSEQRKAQRYAEPETLPDRPDLRDNFAGRVRAALGWFSNLPPLTRRSILIKGLIAAAVAFVIGMGAVFAVEKGIGNSLSCGLWANCPDGAAPGIHLGGDRGTGAGSTLAGGAARNAAPGSRDPAFGQNGVLQDGVQQSRSYEQGNPDLGQPAPRDSGGQQGGQQGGGLFQPDRPAEEPEAPVQETPSSASPAPEEPAPGEEEEEPGIVPQDASPAPEQ